MSTAFSTLSAALDEAIADAESEGTKLHKERIEIDTVITKTEKEYTLDRNLLDAQEAPSHLRKKRFA